MHLDSVYLSKDEPYFAFLACEFSNYVFAVHDPNKYGIREKLTNLISHISAAFPRHKIAYINGDQGTELPSAALFWDE